MGLLFWRRTKWRLTVDNFDEEIVALETQDKDFIERVQCPMNQAAASR
jgi:hypothetical protein